MLHLPPFAIRLIDRARPAAGAVARLAGALGRSKVAHVLVSIAFLAGAVGLLYHQFHTISLAEVIHAARATPMSALAACILLTFGSYASLAGLEWFSLRWLGHPISGRHAAIAAGASYTISNTVGLSAATTTLVRLRCYIPLGLSAGEVGRVSVVTGAGNVLSGMITAGLCLIISALTFARAFPWPAPVMALAVLLLLAPAAMWFVGFRRSGPRWLGADMPIEEPGVTERLISLAVGIADWVLSGGALFMLLPHPELSAFAPFLAVFILGSLLSLASGIPGGLGVFEAVVIGLTTLIAQTHETAAALLLYRLIYSVIPASCVAAAYAAHQTYKGARHAHRRLR